MAVPKTRQELYDIMKAEIQAVRPDLTDFEEGSILDILTGAASTAISESTALVVDMFNKTFFDMAHGPEVTGGVDDLEALAVDHFGSSFARPDSTKSVGIVTFSRASAGAGSVTIPAGTIVKTETDANGQSQRFATQSTVVMSGLTINASVKAVEAGSSGNVSPGSIVVIESTLTDPSLTVTNDDGFSGGSPAQDDSTYRETIRNLITKIGGSVKSAIEAAAKSVPGVESATSIEQELDVIEYDTTTSAIKSGATYFKVPFVKLYVADANGEANDALLNLVESAVEEVRSFGTEISVLAAESIEIDWTATASLNPSGPNFASLSSDLQPVLDSMKQFINNLAIGSGFSKSSAQSAIMAVWGPSGTNDLVSFVINSPAADVAANENQKLIAGTMTIT